MALSSTDLSITSLSIDVSTTSLSLDVSTTSLSIDVSITSLPFDASPTALTIDVSLLANINQCFAFKASKAKHIVHTVRISMAFEFLNKQTIYRTDTLSNIKMKILLVIAAKTHFANIPN